MLSQTAFESNTNRDSVLVLALAEFFGTSKQEIENPYCRHDFNGKTICSKCNYEVYFGAECEAYSLDVELKADKK